MRFCPVCSSMLKLEYENGNEFIVTEVEQVCPNGCYKYVFSYGVTTVLVSGREFTITHLADEEQARNFDIALSEAVEDAKYNSGFKRNWIKEGF